MVQSFIPKTSTIVYSIAKGIAKYINSKESNGSLKSFESIKVQSYIHSYQYIKIFYAIKRHNIFKTSFQIFLILHQVVQM